MLLVLQELDGRAIRVNVAAERPRRSSFWTNMNWIDILPPVFFFLYSFFYPFVFSLISFVVSSFLASWMESSLGVLYTNCLHSSIKIVSRIRVHCALRDNIKFVGTTSSLRQSNNGTFRMLKFVRPRTSMKKLGLKRGPVACVWPCALSWLGTWFLSVSGPPGWKNTNVHRSWWDDRLVKSQSSNSTVFYMPAFLSVRAPSPLNYAQDLNPISVIYCFQLKFGYCFCSWHNSCTRKTKRQTN